MYQYCWIRFTARIVKSRFVYITGLAEAESRGGWRQLKAWLFMDYAKTY